MKKEKRIEVQIRSVPDSVRLRITGKSQENSMDRQTGNGLPEGDERVFEERLNKEFKRNIRIQIYSLQERFQEHGRTCVQQIMRIDSSRLQCIVTFSVRYSV